MIPVPVCFLISNPGRSRHKSQLNERDWTSGSSQPAPHAAQGSLVTNPNTLGGPHRFAKESGDHCYVGSHGAPPQLLSRTIDGLDRSFAIWEKSALWPF
jgi:hypothetical protein